LLPRSLLPSSLPPSENLTFFGVLLLSSDSFEPAKMGKEEHDLVSPHLQYDWGLSVSVTTGLGSAIVTSVQGTIRSVHLILVKVDLRASCPLHTV